MTFDIHFELKDGSEDRIRITAETIKEIRKMAFDEISNRGGCKAWSERVADTGDKP